MSTNYPGRVIKTGEADAALVKKVKKQLNLRLALSADPSIKLDEKDGAFDNATKRVVKFFQARATDAQGNPLVVDGQVGPLTWATLFEIVTGHVKQAATGAFLNSVLDAAKTQIGKREYPKNSNLGPDVEKYQALTGTRGLAWCVSFVYWCFEEAAKKAGKKNPMYKTAGVLKHWQRCESAGAQRIKAAAAHNDPKLIKPGMVFVMDYGGGLGHTGLVVSVDGAYLNTIEGNTDASGAKREGGGVYAVRRKIASINTGFILY